MGTEDRRAVLMEIIAGELELDMEIGQKITSDSQGQSCRFDENISFVFGDILRPSFAARSDS